MVKPGCRDLDPLSMFFSVYLGCWQWDPVPVLLEAKRCSRTDAADVLSSLIIWFLHIYTREAKLDVCTGLMCSPANENISIVLIAAEIVLSRQLTEEQLLKPEPRFSWWMNQLVIRLWAWICSPQFAGLKPSWPIVALRNDSLALTRPQNETGEQTHQTSDSVLNCKQTGKKG